jgi:hypothetical protein
MDLVKKKRGRKPKNFIIEEVVVQQEKKKRGRKKKYEIENFDKILNRNEDNNFNHHVIYSDDETPQSVEESCVKKISFGNLDITVSKKIETENVNDFKFQTRTAYNSTINKDEYSSEEEQEIPLESFIKMNEKLYSENKKYVPKIVSECITNNETLKKLRIVTTTKEQIKCDTEWPESTDVCCWWCCHTFTGCPCTLPVKYDPLRKRYKFIGIFCSWNCVKSYNLDRSDHMKYECTQLITLLVQQLYGIVEAVKIKQAPPRQALKMFGGYLDIEAFRNPTNVDGYHLNLINFNYIYPEIVEISNVKVNQEKKNLRLSRP